MNIHEYQSKLLLANYGVAVPRGGVAFTVEEAVNQAQELGGQVYVVKSQIHAGGRGAGRFKGNSDGKGGVRVVNSVEEVRLPSAPGKTVTNARRSNSACDSTVSMCRS